MHLQSSSLCFLEVGLDHLFLVLRLGHSLFVLLIKICSLKVNIPNWGYKVTGGSGLYYTASGVGLRGLRFLGTRSSVVRVRGDHSFEREASMHVQHVPGHNCPVESHLASSGLRQGI